MNTLIEALETTNWVYLRDKRIHQAFIVGMPFRVVLGFLRNKQFYYAEKED